MMLYALYIAVGRGYDINGMTKIEPRYDKIWQKLRASLIAPHYISHIISCTLGSIYNGRLFQKSISKAHVCLKLAKL